ncbi:MAG: hypothetical protein PHD83_02190 [Caldisericia bacterium]|nr:hypothetical protein [Caldisericia bacterium]
MFTAKSFIVILGYFITLLSSGYIVRFILKKALISIHTSDEKTGSSTVIGKCENLLILTLILTNSISSIAFIMAAKSLFRAGEADKTYIAYYISGTMINLTYSILMGLSIKYLISFL